MCKEMNSYQSFYWSHHSDTLRTQCRHIKHLHEEVWCHKNTFWQNDSILNLAIYFYTLFLMGFVSAQIVHAHGNRLVPELLLKPSDTLHAQCKHIGHLLEEIWCHKVLFWQNYINFDTLFCLCLGSVYACRSTCITAFVETIWYFAYTIYSW